MAYCPGVQYVYKCSCGWRNELEEGLVPYMLVIRCPKCGREAKAERVDHAVGVPESELPQLCEVEVLPPFGSVINLAPS